MEYKKPFLYIDTNFKAEQALMLDMAFRNYDFELVGISTHDGFMGKALAASNILGLVEEYGLYLPVASDEKLDDEDRSKLIFNSKKDYLEKVDPADFLYDLATDCGSLDILAIGNLTNIARALERYDDISDYISHIFCYIDVKNKDIDLDALDKVLSSSIDLFIIDKDLASNILLDDEFLKDLPIEKNIILDEILKKDYDLRDGSSLILMYLMLQPSAFIFDEKALRVDREDLELIHDNNRKKNYLAIRVNEDSFFDYIKASYEN